MCGIAGLVDSALAPDTRRDAVARMCQRMVHRGPDDSGIEDAPDATLGMRRLAIFDPANGHQPMTTSDGRFRLVFNGAIYNFRELRAELASAGFPFRTQCDTEVLLAAFAHWGENCLSRLRGMFAFAVWDTRDRSLFLARDPFGIKPLFYHHDGARLLFASELNALLASGVVATELDPVSLGEYLAWLAVPAPRTIYCGVYSLRPGECATFRNGQLSTRTSWFFRTIPATGKPCRSQRHFERELRTRLDETIRAHVLADVPVGAFLSGGLDSAAVAGLMSRATGTRLKTFTIGFGEAPYNESAAAEATARHLGSEHHTRIITGAEVARDLPQLLAAMDQPTGDGINTYYASQTAHAGGVTVALSGLGGDELFGGYPSFRDLPRLSRLLPSWRFLPSPLRRAVLARLRRGATRSRKLADMLEHARSFQELNAMQRRVFSESRRRELLAPGLLDASTSLPPFHPEFATLSADLANAGSFEAVSAWELRTYMADVLLRDSDVMSMRHSLELRVPFIDRPLIEWLWRQPSHFKHDPRAPKSPLARAVRHILPPDLAQRPKWGFTFPFATWMKAELRPFLDATFSDASIDRSGFFTRDAVQRNWRSFLASDDSRDWSRLWSLAVLIDFANRPPPAPLRPRPWPVELQSATPAAHVVTNRSSKRTCAAKQRTLLLAPEIFASEGGIPRILQIYLKALCDLAGPHSAVRLVSLNDYMVDSRDLRRSSNERLTEWRVCGRNKTRFIRDALALSRGADRLICGHLAQLPVALAAKLRYPRLRYYLIAHGIEVWRDYTTLERLALRRAERILCVSDYTRRELLRHCRLRPDKVVVLPNALDPCFEIAPGAPRGTQPPTILVVTRLSYADRYKGVEHIVKAMPRIRSEIADATLRVIGRGDDLPRLQQVRDQLGLRGAIEFLGYVDDRRMADELRSCSLFALPSEREGFGLVFLEAMANGRPCLGANAGGIPEVITPDTGVLVPYGDVPAIADAAIAALRRDWNETAILDRAREFSYSHFKDRLASLLAL
jgi:asparagine synthase (glutamine-hydrolyzing)